MTHPASQLQLSHPQKHLSIGVAEERILQTLGRYRYATCQQICRANGYASASLTYIQEKMKRLTDGGYCQRPYYPRKKPTGSAPAVYALSGKGHAYLRKQGVELPLRFRPSEERASPFWYDHSLAVIDILISLDLLTRRYPHVELRRLVSERELKRLHVCVTDAEGRSHAVINDAFVELRIDRLLEMCLAIEVDRGTAEQKSWRRKVAHLVAACQGPFQAAYATSALTIVVTTPSEKRRDVLRRWTEAELRHLTREDQADLFRFTAALPHATTPETLFFTPVWYRPFDQGPLALLPTKEANG